MSDHLKDPPNAQVTSEKSPIRTGPADMPDRGGPKPNAQSTATAFPMSRTENSVAQFGARPNMGTVQSTSETVPLSRGAATPYDSVNKTKPQSPFVGKGKGK